MENEFTPGPWRYHENIQVNQNMCSVPYYEISSKESMFWLAQINASGRTNKEGEAAANAALIAAAPDMLEALNTIVDNAGNSNLPDEYYVHQLAMDEVKAAIAKATNEIPKTVTQ